MITYLSIVLLLIATLICWITYVFSKEKRDAIAASIFTLLSCIFIYTGAIAVHTYTIVDEIRTTTNEDEVCRYYCIVDENCRAYIIYYDDVKLCVGDTFKSSMCDLNHKYPTINEVNMD